MARRERRQNRRAAVEPMERRPLMAATLVRPPAVPLVVNDPDLTVWSAANNLTDAATTEWGGTRQALVGPVRVDNVTDRLMGTMPSTAPAFPQVGLQITPTRLIYDVDGGHVHIPLTFMTPELTTNLVVLSRPITYAVGGLFMRMLTDPARSGSTTPSTTSTC